IATTGTRGATDRRTRTTTRRSPRTASSCGFTTASTSTRPRTSQSCRRSTASPSTRPASGRRGSPTGTASRSLSTAPSRRTPAIRGTPWEPDRYGFTVVVDSDEPTSPGYTAVLVHLDKVWVDIGQHVMRGQVIGVLGRTGNAEDVAPQLHFELRAPFEIDWSS